MYEATDKKTTPHKARDLRLVQTLEIERNFRMEIIQRRQEPSKLFKEGKKTANLNDKGSEKLQIDLIIMKENGQMCLLQVNIAVD